MGAVPKSHKGPCLGPHLQESPSVSSDRKEGKTF